MDKLWQVWQISCTAERDSLIFSRDIFDASTFCSSSKFYSPTKSRTSQITNFDMYSFRAAQLFLLFEQIYAAALLRKTTAGANAIQQLAEQLPRGVTRELFQSFSICGSCNTWKRFGEENDGGYLLCMDSLNASDLKAAYSMGVQKHDQFSLDVYKAFNVPVFQYDCTVSHPAQICDKCQFFPACLSSKFPGKTSWTLKEAIEQLKMLDVPDRSLLMKMDIERGRMADTAGSRHLLAEEISTAAHWVPWSLEGKATCQIPPSDAEVEERRLQGGTCPRQQLRGSLSQWAIHAPESHWGDLGCIPSLVGQMSWSQLWVAGPAKQDGKYGHCWHAHRAELARGASRESQALRDD